MTNVALHGGLTLGVAEGHLEIMAKIINAKNINEEWIKLTYRCGENHPCEVRVSDISYYD